MVKKLNKKGFAGFDSINTGMISLIAFVLVITLVILFVAVLQDTGLVCDGTNLDGTCYACPSGYGINTTSKYCCNVTTSAGTATSSINCSTSQMIVAPESSTNEWNASKNLQSAANLPPQFAEIIVIVIVIVGILGLLAMIGYSVYNKVR